jgi:hypothetical protein
VQVCPSLSFEVASTDLEAFDSNNRQTGHDSDYDDDDSDDEKVGEDDSDKVRSVWQQSNAMSQSEYTHKNTQDKLDPHSQDVAVAT